MVIRQIGNQELTLASIFEPFQMCPSKTEIAKSRSAADLKIDSMKYFTQITQMKEMLNRILETLSCKILHLMTATSSSLPSNEK